MNAIEKAADLLDSWSGQVDETHAQPGTVEAMRSVASEVRIEYARLTKSPGAQLDAVIKAWGQRALAALPRGPGRAWTRTGEVPEPLRQAVAQLPEAVRALVMEHVADDLGECECCRTRAPCRLQSDGTPSGERDWRCAWGCPPPEDDPAETERLRAWARETGL